jgi:hypothetical protein
VVYDEKREFLMSLVGVFLAVLVRWKRTSKAAVGSSDEAREVRRHGGLVWRRKKGERQEKAT